MSQYLPNIADWHFWAFVAAMICWLAVTFDKQIAAVLGKIRLPAFGGGSSSAKAAPPTAIQAFAALIVLANFKKNSSADAAYNAVMAAWKSEAPAA